MVQRVKVYSVKLGVRDPTVGKIAVIDGVDSKAERDLGKVVWDAFEKDPMLGKIVLNRCMIPEHEAN